ncbi:MAG: glycosyltransferase family 4 protein [Saprospiraceae bacterium]
MKILILTQYFPPETGAPQNRLYEIALRLKALGAEVSVLTGFPNYPKYEVFEAYRGKFYKREDMDGLDVHRAYIYARPGKGLLNRMLNYCSFVFSSLWIGLFKVGKAELIICESPPLFLGWTAVWLKRAHRAKLLFNVSDLWPESVLKLGLVKNPLLLKTSVWLEEWIYKKSDLISGQTQGIVADIRKRFPHKSFFWLKNGVDAADLNKRLTGRNWRKEHGFAECNLLFYFGGLLGYAQGIDCIIEAATQLSDLPQVKFVIVGEGPEKERLMRMKQDLGTENVFFFPGVAKAEIANVIQAMDVGIIPLRKLDIFRGAIPSKIFEILCLKKPVLLGIEGEAKALFIEEADSGWAFEPENAGELATLIRQINSTPEMLREKGENGYRYVCQHFDHQQIADDFWRFLNGSIPERCSGKNQARNSVPGYNP